MAYLDRRQKITRSFCLMVILSLLAIFNSNLLNAAELEAQRYVAGMHESVWGFSGSGVSCELQHEIPQFGLARFRRIAGDNLHFLIDSYQPIPEKVEAVLREVSPAWEHNEPDSLKQMVVIHSGMRPLQLDRKQAGWLLTSLTKGQLGSFDFLDWDDSRRQVQVQLSPVNFQKAYRQFKQCLRQLQNNGLTDYRHTVVHFALDVDTPDKQAQQQLNQLAAYIVAEEKINRIMIAGHADDQGGRRYNKRLSARRAEHVYRYLSKKGVKQILMTQRHYGESKPKIAKQTEMARAENRRVKISLQR
ncbi:MAG: OmpA family protein [Candidatus Thiodiazotropha sp. (ex Lucinoma annulata)]|nr:OmpA family protein [Candidatus Thiodiazotropha sp. (ex Lucinoma annulata)]